MHHPCSTLFLNTKIIIIIIIISIIITIIIIRKLLEGEYFLWIFLNDEIVKWLNLCEI